MYRKFAFEILVLPSQTYSFQAISSNIAPSAQKVLVRKMYAWAKSACDRCMTKVQSIWTMSFFKVNYVEQRQGMLAIAIGTEQELLCLGIFGRFYM